MLFGFRNRVPGFLVVFAFLWDPASFAGFRNFRVFCLYLGFCGVRLPFLASRTAFRVFRLYSTHFSAFFRLLAPANGNTEGSRCWRRHATLSFPRNDPTDRKTISNAGGPLRGSLLACDPRKLSSAGGSLRARGRKSHL